MADNKDILLASLIGAEVMKHVPRLSAVQNEMMKRVTRGIPFLPFKKDFMVHEPKDELTQFRIWEADKQPENKHYFPVYIKRPGDGQFYLLPYEPMVSISGKNNIIKRSIAKAPQFVGTIKEHWSQDDYDITITGILMGDDEISNDYQVAFPREDFEALRDYCLSPNGLEVNSPIFELLGIDRIVVEDFAFPFTKGNNVQGYNIKAVSDYSAEFLLEIEDN